jgi:hypothetical protein
MCSLEFQRFQTFNFYEEHLNYVLDPRKFVVEKLPDDGTLVSKHVGVGT